MDNMIRVKLKIWNLLIIWNDKQTRRFGNVRSQINFRPKLIYVFDLKLNLKAPSNNVKTQSNKSLTTKIYLFLTTKQLGLFLNETT